jgi:uncharacterized protein (DUF433 family)
LASAGTGRREDAIMNRSMEEDWDWQSHINIDPKIQGGKPVIRGTRVPVEVLIRHLAAGDTIEALGESYRVTEEDIRAALAYAAQMLHEERVYALPRR